MRLLLVLLLLASSSAHASMLYYQDWEARAWKQRVQTNTPLSGFTCTAANRWFMQTRQAGLRKGISRANFFAGGTAAAAGIPCIADIGSATEALTGASPTYSDANGVTFTAAGTDMFNTGASATNFALNSAHLAFYLGGTPGQDGNVPMGSQDFPNKLFFSMVAGFTAVGESVNIWTNAGYAAVANTNGTGYYLGSRTSGATTGVKMYRFGNLSGTSTAVGSSPPNFNVYSMGLNTGGSPTLATGKKGLGYQMGAGFTDVQAGNSATIWQRFETGMSRAVTPF